MATKEIAKAVYGAIRPLLEDMGFKKRAGNVYTREVAPGVLGRVGFGQRTNRATGVVQFAPMVGVRYQVLEELYAELMERKFDRYGGRTIGTALGYVMPEHRYLEWAAVSPDEKEAEHIAIGIVERIEYYGIPYMEKYKSLREGVSQMNPQYLGRGNPGGWEPLAIAYAMLGERDKSFEVIAHGLEKSRDGPTWLKKRDREFDRKFRERIDSIPVVE